ncbi:hypothetical protein CGGC5_v007287 [Colletotrichum fructicola Nara gc5]|uniref:Fungal N-terminal domain-containing protein n=1 Tax=Colletotrichum fructicola (strain Nara gc5) TaxID=1213859 RepID=A0A7J6J3M4_COLFN|nr:hypothetical protein CFRS1_v006403 [Colletotrichum fructicola]KAF4484431.1 hypothetical protein CGGC5_v007287 [Colletotrichum fructicola Nara gc5]
MAEPIGTTASIVGLIGATIKIIQAVRQTPQRIVEAPRILADASSVLDAVYQTLNLVQYEPQLQTLEVDAQVGTIQNIALDFRELLSKIHERRQRGLAHKIAHALKSGEADDKSLTDILSRLDNARSELHTRISVIHVGLSGNLQEGYRVAFNILEDTNNKVKQVLGLNLTLAERLRNRDLRRADSDTFLLDFVDVIALGLSDQPNPDQGNSAHPRPHEQSERLRFHNNVTGDEPRIFVGNLGIEGVSDAGKSRSNISDNHFGKGASFMVADVGGDAAVNISKSFFQ